VDDSQPSKYASGLNKLTVLLLFQNLNTRGRSTKSETTERMTGKTPGAPSAARIFPTPTSEYFDDNEELPVRLVA
jgi:hypothetical protein